jgi:hypothetical protein
MPSTEDRQLSAVLDAIVPGAGPATGVVAHRLDGVDGALARAALAGASSDVDTWVARAAAARSPAFVVLRRWAWDAYFSSPAHREAVAGRAHPKSRHP